MKELYSAARATPRPRWLTPFGFFTLVFLIHAQFFAFTKSPAEAGMGHTQKIMYVHVPAAWSCMLAFFVVFVASIAYLITRRERWDFIGEAAAEAGVVMAGLTLALGSIWGRPTWGVWWTWDPRITATAIMMLMYVGYLALRGFTDDDERRARWSAVIGFVAFLNVPIVWWSVQWWSTMHPKQTSSTGMAGIYWTALWLNAVAFLFVLVFFIASRYHVAQLERAAALRLEEEALGR